MAPRDRMLVLGDGQAHAAHAMNNCARAWINSRRVKIHEAHQKVYRGVMMCSASRVTSDLISFLRSESLAPCR